MSSKAPEPLVITVVKHYVMNKLKDRFGTRAMELSAHASYDEPVLTIRIPVPARANAKDMMVETQKMLRGIFPPGLFPTEVSMSVASVTRAGVDRTMTVCIWRLTHVAHAILEQADPREYALALKEAHAKEEKPESNKVARRTWISRWLHEDA